MVSAVATSVAILVEMGRAEVAATTNFAALVGGNFTAVRNLTLTMVDQVCHTLPEFPPQQRPPDKKSLKCDTTCPGVP